MLNQKRLVALTGLFIWLLLILFFWPPSPLSLDYVRLILVAAPLLIVPLCLGEFGLSRWLTIALGAAFAIGMLIIPGWLAAALTLPWWLLSIYLGYQSSKVFKKSNLLSSLLILAGPIFLFTAACWALADRLELRPMGFGSDIVLLTAVHFHYAGFTLTWLVRKFGGPVWMKLGILSGVGLVAIGITASQYQLPPWIEVVSVSILAVCTFRFALGLLQLGNGLAGWSLRFGGLALATGMLLALCYGWRYYFPVPALDIPLMYAIHGSLNSLVFAIPTVWAATFTREWQA